MSELGHSRRFIDVRGKSALPPTADVSLRRSEATLSARSEHLARRMRRLYFEFFSECGDIDPVFLFIDIRIFELHEPFGRDTSDALASYCSLPGERSFRIRETFNGMDIDVTTFYIAENEIVLARIVARYILVAARA